jgi:hypothetical protein
LNSKIKIFQLAYSYFFLLVYVKLAGISDMAIVKRGDELGIGTGQGLFTIALRIIYDI